jgi:hypothetical protein
MNLSIDVRTSERQVVQPEFLVENGDRAIPRCTFTKVAASEEQDTEITTGTKKITTETGGLTA